MTNPTNQEPPDTSANESARLAKLEQKLQVIISSVARSIKEDLLAKLDEMEDEEAVVAGDEGRDSFGIKHLPPTPEHVGLLLDNGFERFEERIQRLIAAFMAAFELASYHGNTREVYFDDAFFASCFMDVEDVEPTRRILEERLNELFLPNYRSVALSAEAQDLFTPYRGDRYGFTAVITEMGAPE